jgi:hypothetical protein
MSEKNKRKTSVWRWDGSHVKVGENIVVIYISTVRNGTINPFPFTLPIRRGKQSKRYGLILQVKSIVGEIPIDLYICL